MAKHTAEDELVHRLSRGFPSFRESGIRLGGGDDAALWAPRRGYETILTSDWFLEGSHFLRDTHPADSVGWKCLARAASDLAAMGGAPRCFLLNLALPSSHTGKWLDGFVGGLRRAGRFLHCAMAGGDTTRNQRILINVTVVGEIEKGKAVLRSGAKAGDLLYVSGRLGLADLGLRELRRGRGLTRAKNQALRKHLYPEPRIALGSWLASRGLAKAMMDVSDGLSTDLARLCAASGVGAKLDMRKLPMVESISRRAALQLALHGGDEYELLFATRAAAARKIPRRLEGVEIHCIGEIMKRKRIVLTEARGTQVELRPGGWDPFRK